MESCLSLEKYLHEQIPISKAMGVHVEHISKEKVTLKASFFKNINHKRTAFGGSLSAVAALACWSLLHLNLTSLFGEHRVQIVISSSDTEYLSPVTEDIVTTCYLPEPDVWDHFTKTLQRRGKARIKLKIKIYSEEQLAVTFTGTFVAITKGGQTFSDAALL